jgi:serine/threonine protein phosphatase 1
MKKIFAIGDIHGCLEQLQKLILSLDIDRQNDTLLFIGDYIDRGRAGREVVEYVIQLRQEFRNVVFLLGNHEYMLLRYLEGIDEDMYLYNGGRVTMADYHILPSDPPKSRKEKIPAEHLHFFQTLLPCYETEEHIFVHAGLKPGLSPGEQPVHNLLWVRQEFIDSDYDFGKRVIFGHTPLSHPLISPNKIGIDTGAVYGGKLTCVELPAVKIYQV